MNAITATTICEQWRQGKTALGAWVMIPSTVNAEVTSRCGFDYVCVDAQHGPLDYTNSVEMITAILFAGASPIVRVPRNDPGIIGKFLDAGAHGVIIPMLNNAADVETAVQACRYAPRGNRSWGPTIPALRQDYSSWEPGNIACIPMIETAEALTNIDEILEVPDVDAIYVGPADLSLSLGLSPKNNDGEALFDNALKRVLERCAAHQVIAGIHSTATLARQRIEAGFRMVTVTSDLRAVRFGLETALAQARSG